MLLRQLLQSRFESSLSIYDRAGNKIPDEQVKEEYKNIKHFLLDHYAGKRVAIKLTKDYRYLLSMLACMEIGIPYIPMKFDYPTDRIEQIRESSNFSYIIDDQNINEILIYKNRQQEKLPEISPEQEAYIIFTSGSTGRPKGVIIPRNAWENFFSFIGNNFPQVTQNDKLLQHAEFTFDLSMLDVALFITKNVGFHFSNFNNNIFKLGHEIATHRISILNTVPNNLNMFLTKLVAEKMDYQCLKHLFIGGARFSYGLYEKCLKYFNSDVAIYNFYGPTEATVYSHFKKITYETSVDCIDGNVSIGKVLPNMKAHIVVDGVVAAPFTKGELYIGGIQLMQGYMNSPEQTNQALVQFEGETFYRTGDLAFQNQTEEFFIVGRTDDTIKYRGFRINLLDIDSYISRLPYVQDSVTIAIPNEATENQTLGFIILKEKKSIKEIKEDMSKLLLDYQIPEKIIFVEQYPTNNSGKVCRKTLREQYLESLKA